MLYQIFLSPQVKRIEINSNKHGTYDCNWTRNHNHFVHKWTFNHLAKLAKWLHCAASTCLYGAFDCVLYHATYAPQSESTLHSCLNVKELVARNRCEIRSLSYCNSTRTYNHLVRKPTLNHLAKLARWFSCVVRTYLYGAFHCMFSSCYVRVLE